MQIINLNKLDKIKMYGLFKKPDNLTNPTQTRSGWVWLDEVSGWVEL